MPAYNFKREFAGKIEAGTKRHTIRKERKYPTKQGQELSLYTGMRTKNCRLLRRSPCLAVLPVQIHRTSAIVDGVMICDEELATLAHDDGFESSESFIEFFRKQYGLPFRGVLIKW